MKITGQRLRVYFIAATILIFGSVFSAQAANPGDVIVSEIMQNPSAVSDSAGEWFELYNTTAAGIDIDGWTIQDNDLDSHVINNGGPLILPAGGYLVLGNNNDSATNGGVNVDYAYPTTTNWFLSNSADEVVLLDDSLTEIDRVEYDGGPGFPDPNGASMALKDPALDNNVGANWCTSSTPFGHGDLGTPGAANDCAPSYITIYDIQYTIDSSGDSPYVGQEDITTEGIVTAVFYNGYFIGDPAGGAWNGLWVYDSNTPARGDRVRLTGKVIEYFGLTELTNLTDYEVLSSGNPIPAPEVLASGDVSQEHWEGVLVRVENVSVSDDDLGYGEWLVNDGSGDVVIDDKGSYAYIPTAGDALSAVIGPLDYSYGAFKIQPRDDGDIIIAAPPSLIINEIHADPDSANGDANEDGTRHFSDDEFVEIVNNSDSEIDISGWNLSDSVGVRHIFPSGTIVAARCVIVIFGGGSPTGMFGGAVVQTASSGALGLNNSGDTVTLSNGFEVQAAVGYGSEGGDNQSLTLDPDITGSSFVKHSLASNSGGALFSPGTLVDGSNFAGCDLFGACGDPATYIHTIQGNGASSPEQGNIHVIEAVVVGDFQNIGGTHLRGFFVQEEDSEADGDLLTSEGIFVYDGSSPTVDVNAGDVVRVMGEVTEYFGLTQLSTVTHIEVCPGGGSVSAAMITLPVSSLDVWEQYEGMSITLPQTLYATDNYNLGRYGEVSLSLNDRLFAPTNVVAPGTPANNLQDLNDRSMIQMDDGSTAQNPNPVPYLAPDGTLRAGDTISGLSGVLGYAYNVYEIHPTEAVNFARVNDRNPTPPISSGRVKVASFNVLNYFTTLDDSGPICGPEEDQGCRGADTAEEFTRQRDKIIRAIASMDADVIGLMELENHPTDVALQDLVSGLNDFTGSGTYSALPTGPIGADVIRVAFIYKPAGVTPVGSHAVLDSSVDPTFLDDKNRPALAQTFQQNDNGEKLTAVVNHFKSKGSPCDDVGDPDMGDGQGNCNSTRTDAAIALVNWLLTDPTQSGDPDFLIIGDLNAYAMEDPIEAIKNAGYTDLVEQFMDDAYSCVFFGQAGYLDHALASSSLAAQVSATTIWHINADEPDALNYNDYNQDYLYNPDPHRSSDHDPVIVGLDMNAPPDCSGAEPSKALLWPANHKLVSIEILGITDADGDAVTVTIDSIYQDEPVDSKGDGKFAPDGFGVGSSSASIRAERKGSGNGRVYHIGFSADDGKGGQCTGSVIVGIPNSKGRNGSPIDDGAIFDSTVY